MRQSYYAPKCGSMQPEKVTLTVTKAILKVNIPVFICTGCGIMFVDNSKNILVNTVIKVSGKTN